MELVGYLFIGMWLLSLVGWLSFPRQRFLSGFFLAIFAVLSAGLIVTFLNQFTE